MFHFFKNKFSKDLTKNKTLLYTVDLLKEPDFENPKKLKFDQKRKGSNYQTIRQDWKAVIKENQATIEQLYHNGTITDWAIVRAKMEKDFTFEDQIINLLVNWLEKIDWSKKEDVKILHKYITLVSNSDFGNCYLAIRKYHTRILAIIKQLILKEDYIIEPGFNNTNLGALVENMINLYFYHASNTWNNKNHIAQYDIDRKEIAEIIPNFIKAFPKNCSGLTMYLLENNNSNLVPVCADLLHFYIVNKIDDNYSLTSELFSGYQKPSDPIYKKAPLILKETLQNTLSDDQVDYLIDAVLLEHLNIGSLENHIIRTEKHLNRLRKYKKDKFVAEQEKELAKFIANFDKTYPKRWLKAVRRLAVSRSIYKSVETVVKTYPEHQKTQLLIKLFEETKTYKNKPKIYNLNQKPSIVFKDLHLKYLVIEELMYNQQILKPIFDVRHFAAEYSKREIDIEAEGYEIIPEVKKYFKNLDIPMDLLKKVTTLYQDSGLGGGSGFIYQMYPFWDPGAGDEPYKITAKAINDLDFLPNLKNIIGLENSNPSKKLLKALEDKNIVLENEA